VGNSQVKGLGKSGANTGSSGGGVVETFLRELNTKEEKHSEESSFPLLRKGEKGVRAKVPLSKYWEEKDSKKRGGRRKEKR